MAHGAPSPNGQAARLLEEAHQQEAAQRELLMLLRQTMHHPHAEHRYKTCLVGIGWEGPAGKEFPMVLVALPTGERHEFPITDAERRSIVAELSKPDQQIESETEKATRGGVELDKPEPAKGARS